MNRLFSSWVWHFFLHVSAMIQPTIKYGPLFITNFNYLKIFCRILTLSVRDVLIVVDVVGGGAVVDGC